MAFFPKIAAFLGPKDFYELQKFHIASCSCVERTTLKKKNCVWCETSSRILEIRFGDSSYIFFNLREIKFLLIMGNVSADT